MAYNSNTPKQSFTATAGQTEFDFDFKIFNESDMVVYKTPSGQSPSDIDDLLTITSDYTVSITGDDGGTVTLTSGASNGDTIVLLRSIPISREVDYQQGGDILADTLDDDQDLQTYLIADISESNKTSIRLPDSAVSVETQLPDVVADSYLKWNSTGDALENDTTMPDSVDLAKRWANEDEDVVVADGEYSSKHYSIKSRDEVTLALNARNQAEQYAIEAEASADRAEAFDPENYKIDVTLSGATTVNENSDLVLTITDYDASANYEVSTPTGTAVVVGDTITVSVGSVSVDTPYILSVTGTKEWFLPRIVTYGFTVLNVPIQNDTDTYVDVTGTDFNHINFPTVEGGYLDEGLVGIVKGGDGSLNTSTTDAVPTMTSNTAPSGVASANGESLPAYNAFDDTTSSYWRCATTTGWLTYQFPSPKVINKYTVTCVTAFALAQPKNWTIKASSTGLFTGEEVILHTVIDETAWANLEKRTFTFINNVPYLYYRIDVTSNNGRTDSVTIAELEFIEAQDIAEATYTSSQVTKVDGDGNWIGTQDTGYITSELPNVLANEGLEGDELVVDGSGNWVGDFDVQADVDAWSTSVVPLLSVDTLQLTTTNDSCYLPIQTESGKTYTYSGVLTGVDGGNQAQLRIGTTIEAFDIDFVTNDTNVPTTLSSTFIGIGGLVYVTALNTGSSPVFFDNISVKAVSVPANSTDMIVNGQVTDGDVLYVGDSTNFATVVASGVVDNLDGTYTLPHNQSFTPTFASLEDNVSYEVTADGTNYEVQTKDNAEYISGEGTDSITIKENFLAHTFANAGQLLGFKVKHKEEGTKTTAIFTEFTETGA